MCTFSCLPGGQLVRYVINSVSLLHFIAADGVQDIMDTTIATINKVGPGVLVRLNLRSAGELVAAAIDQLECKEESVEGRFAILS